MENYYSLTVSLNFPVTTRRRVMARRPTFLYGAFPRALSLLIALSACAAQSLAQGGATTPNSPGRGVSHTIRGKIFMPSGSPPDQRLRVVLELNTGGIVNEVFSDSVGNFEFRSLPNGTYKIVAPSDGRIYETAQESVELYGNFARTYTVQIYLKEKGEGVTVKSKEKIVSIADLQKPPKEAKKNYDNGLKRAHENKPEEAVALFQAAVKIFPEYLAAINKLGERDFAYVRLYLFNLNLRRQKLDKAAEQLEAYLKEAPDAPDAEQVRQRLDKVKKAIAQQKG